MADRAKRLPENVEGEFFVDSTCIDCDTCRQLAPSIFAETGAYSAVFAQPGNANQRREAMRALVACPTGSIGAGSSAREAVADFPLRVEDEIYYCGFNSPKSFGGNSYFVQRPEGNWLIDSPRFTAHLVRRFAEMGGIRYIFLTHRDDVADAEKYAYEFGSTRIIHRRELCAQPGAEQVIDGFEPSRLAPEFLVIPTPGHTPGHCALLYREAVLFTGDHLWWSRERQALSASRDVCWHSWPQQVASMDQLRQFSFKWVLPGHGQRIKLEPGESAPQLERLLERMRGSR